MFLLAAGSNYKAGNTGGEATHKLTEAELPSKLSVSNTDTWYGTSDYDSIANAYYYSNSYQATNIDLKTSGQDKPHNNMPPYLVVYVWKRVA